MYYMSPNKCISSNRRSTIYNKFSCFNTSIPRDSSEERKECSPKTIHIGDSREQA